MLDFLKLDKLGGSFASLQRAVSEKNTAVFSLSPGGRAHIAAALPSFVLYVAPDRPQAREMQKKLSAFKKTVLIHEKDDLLLHRRAVSAESVAERISALSEIISGGAEIAVISAEGLLQPFPLKKRFTELIQTVECGREYQREALLKKLASAGYARVETVSAKGEFALRGDIADIYPINSANPIRISFFDELVEEIKEFDAETMISGKRLSRVYLPPVSDILFTAEETASALQKLAAAYLGGRQREIIADLQLRTGFNPSDASFVWLIPFIKNAFDTVFSYLPEGAVVIFDEPKLVADKLKLYFAEHKKRVISLFEANESTEKHLDSLYTPEKLEKEWQNFRLVSFQQIVSVNPLFEPRAVFNIKSRAVTKYYLDRASLISELKVFAANDMRVALCAASAERAKVIAEQIFSDGIFASAENGFSGKSRIIVTDAEIETGFIYPEAGLVVAGTAELIGKRRETTSFRPKKEFIAPKAGDYVVHNVHGIGLCQGTTKLKFDNVIKEFVVLTYRDGDTLYVATDQMSELEKYTGGGTPRLNKLGGKEFSKVKEKIKGSVKKLAFDLLSLYAERASAKGFKYSPDTVWQNEFEDAFEFQETEDQLDAVKKIKEEMEAGKVIDRLICGDVGFGKTEVALRAVFKTIMDGRQAAILAPTTILARQHFNVLSARLEPFGIKAELLSRFQKPAEIEASLKRLASGESLVAVATHRLLSEDVKFKELGLLVLDEEQRFGVSHKEKMKAVSAGVNVLTLTATPIPRTLNMALTGIRDISLLDTPPAGRLPIQTYITEYSEGLLKDALSRELARGGQAFILYNKVETIDAFAHKVRAFLDDEARIIVGHGQLKSEVLEERMAAFYAGEADILVATTIIENGIDLPDANTLIVIDADCFGLAQLYQLRGRVGRSGHLAHAYFTTTPGKVLTDDAVKRLLALMDNTEFGSGFKIAMRDLEIRGAGNILGAEQHGHIEKVGYSMYVKLLEESVRELKGEKIRSESEVEIKIDADTYIRDSYVSDRDKIRIYKEIAEVKSEASRDKLVAEITDIYGPPDRPLLNLIDIALLKNLAGGFGARKITITKSGAGIAFENSVFENADVLNAVANLGGKAVLTSTIPPQLLFDVKNMTAEQKIKTILSFFTSLASAAG